jgi:hypothetical protein
VADGNGVGVDGLACVWRTVVLWESWHDGMAKRHEWTKRVERFEPAWLEKWLLSCSFTAFPEQRFLVSLSAFGFVLVIFIIIIPFEDDMSSQRSASVCLSCQCCAAGPGHLCRRQPTTSLHRDRSPDLVLCLYFDAPDRVSKQSNILSATHSCYFNCTSRHQRSLSCPPFLSRALHLQDRHLLTAKTTSSFGSSPGRLKGSRKP